MVEDQQLQPEPYKEPLNSKLSKELGSNTLDNAWAKQIIEMISAGSKRVVFDSKGRIKKD